MISRSEIKRLVCHEPTWQVGAIALELHTELERLQARLAELELVRTSYLRESNERGYLLAVAHDELEALRAVEQVARRLGKPKSLRDALAAVDVIRKGEP
jgi:hypothetical protein